MPSSHLILCRPLLLLPPQSLPASESFPMSQLFTWGGQSTGVSALASVLPKNTLGWSPLGWTGWISLQSKDSQESSPTPQFKSFNSSALSFLYSPTLTSYMTTGKTIALTRRTFVGKVISLLSNMLSRFVSFSSKEQISFNFMAAVTICSEFGAQKDKVCHCFHCFSICLPMKWWDWMPWSLFSECWALSQLFTLLFHFCQEAL